MKKKLLAMLFVMVVLVFALAITSSAIDYAEKVTLKDGTVLPLYNESNESLIWFVTGTDENGAKIYDSVAVNNGTADNATNYVTYNINSTYGKNQMHDVYIKRWNSETSTYDSYNEGAIAIFNVATLTREYWSIGAGWSGDNLEYVYHSSTARDSGDFTGYANLQIVDFSLTTNFEAFGEQAFKGCSSLREVRIGNSETGYGLTCQNGNLFNGCISLTKITFADISDVTSIVGKAFYDCKSLTGTYEFSNVTLIENEAFRGCAINEGTYLKLSFPSLTSLGTGGSNTFVFAYSGVQELYFGDDITHMSYNTFTGSTKLWKIEFAGVASGFSFPSYTFEDCSALKAFSIPEGLTALPSRMFKSCTSLKAVYLPSTLTTINSGSQDHATFANCTNMYFVDKPFTFTGDSDIPAKPDVYYFPSGLTAMSEGEVFKNCKSLNKTLVFPTGVTSITNAWAFCSSSDATLENIVFLGNMENIKTGSWNFSGKIYFANENDKSSSDIATYSNSKSTVFCFADGNTTHLVEPKKTESTEATCETNRFDTTYCFCGTKIDNNKEIANTKLGHDYTVLTSIKYTDYTANGTKTYTCSRKDCGCTEDKSIEAIIYNFTGYSAPVDPSKVGLCFGYDINVVALAEYNSVNDDLKFGVVGVLETYLGTKTPLTDKGEVNDEIEGNVIVADISNTNSKTIDFIITGSKEQWESTQIVNGVSTNLKELAIIMAGYVYDGNGVHYIQSKGTTSTFETVSYATVSSNR